MRNFIYIAALSISLGSCGGGDDPAPAPVNKAPTVPTLVYPTDNLLCIENPVTCKWNASTDSDGDVITYQIEVAENSAFTQGKQSFNSTSLTQSVPLLEDVAYYWRIKATDGKDSSSYSSVYKFYTYGVGVTNHLPFSPELVSPDLNKVVKSTDYLPYDQLNVILEWSASDIDVSDTLTYDVYFGTSTEKDNLPKVSQNQNAKTFTVALAASTTYYWKVVVKDGKDGKGGQTVGQVWSFTTD